MIEAEIKDRKDPAKAISNLSFLGLSSYDIKLNDEYRSIILWEKEV